MPRHLAHLASSWPLSSLSQGWASTQRARAIASASGRRRAISSRSAHPEPRRAVKSRVSAAALRAECGAPHRVAHWPDLPLAAVLAAASLPTDGKFPLHAREPSTVLASTSGFVSVPVPPVLLLNVTDP